MTAHDASSPPCPGAVPADDPRLEGVRQLLWLMDRLRGEGGCPWDREQTHQSLRSYLMEEAYEVLEVLDSGDWVALKEELGDLLFQVVFHARIAEDEGRHDFGDVAAGIAAKLYRRHPHVFQEGEEVEDAAEVLVKWAEHKRREGRTSALQGVPPALPALLRAQRVQAKAAGVGFDWPDTAGPRAKLSEELEELDREIAGGDRAAQERELGDLLFSAVNLARHLGLDAETALRGTTKRFASRFRHVEVRAEGNPAQHSLETLEAWWQEAKALEGSPQGADEA